MTRRPTVALLHLGAAGSFGGRRRVASLTEIFTAAGADVVPVALLEDHRATARDLLRPGFVALLRATAVPEALAWSRRSVQDRLEAVRPDLVVCCTARAYHPELADGPWHLVLDYVDRLSDSYQDRARIIGASARSVVFKILARTARRFERRPLPPGSSAVAAGWDDARSLGCEWLPITIEATDHPVDGGREPRYDVLFLGKLSYPPNVEAIERLGTVWPAVLDARPGTTLLLAGAAPERAVLALAARSGWTVEADFDDLAEIMAAARLSTSPLEHASGIQIKVLDAATHGVAQVIGPTVAKGFAPGMPAEVVDDDAQLVEALVRLLDDPSRREALAAEALAHVRAEYSVERWSPWATEVLGRVSR